MKPQLLACAALALVLAGCQAKPTTTVTTAVPAGEPVVAPGKTPAPAGTYALDPAHSTLVFRLSHMGFSKYTAGFSKLAGKLNFDPDHPEAMTVEATIDPASLTQPSPPPGFRETLLGPQWLNVARYPQITFRSTKVTTTGPNTADVTGDFTFHGVTKPLVLHVTFNGGYAPNPYDGARVGFSGKTSFKRSEFGMGGGVPAPGTNLGVGDNVEVILETEWNSGKPTAAGPAK